MSKTYNTTIDASLKPKVMEYAKETGRTQSGLIAYLLKKELRLKTLKKLNVIDDRKKGEIEQSPMCISLDEKIRNEAYLYAKSLGTSLSWLISLLLKKEMKNG